ncbi:MAG: 6-phospho-beta-glucosidase [Clostridiales bacterium]|nr:6-phospho-beta-glucosidase [Clostridiales bacterium]
MKLTIIGGGGVRSIFLAKSVAERAEKLNIAELVLMDNDVEKLHIYGRLAKCAAAKICPKLNVTLTPDAKAAIEGADYIITTIRAGGDEMRVKDEREALRLGVLGQETTGAAGLSFAMRSVGALAGYCEMVKKYARKGCKVFNFTNPAGIVSQTLYDMGYDFTFGICDAPSSMLRSFEKLCGAGENSAVGEIYGLNHLSYFTSIKIDGKEMLPKLINMKEAYEKTDMRLFDKELLLARKAILNEYLYYFYYSEKALKNILNAPKTRGEQILEINKKMTAALKDIDIEKDFDGALETFVRYYAMRESSYMAAESAAQRSEKWHFDLYEKDPGGYAGVALRFIEIEQSAKKQQMILCVPNNGAVPGLRDNDIVEITCDVEPGAVTPHRFSEIDEQNFELIRRVKNYERLASEAIRTKSISKCIDALTLHPLVNSYSIARELAVKYIEMNSEYIKGWK